MNKEPAPEKKQITKSENIKILHKILCDKGIFKCNSNNIERLYDLLFHDFHDSLDIRKGDL